METAGCRSKGLQGRQGQIGPSVWFIGHLAAVCSVTPPPALLAPELAHFEYWGFFAFQSLAVLGQPI